MKNSKIYIYLAGALACLILIIVVLTWGDPQKDLLDQMIAAEVKDQEEQGPTSGKQYQAILAALKAEPALFMDQAAIWQSQLKLAEQTFENARNTLTGAKQISEKKQDELYAKALSDLQASKQARTEMQKIVSGIHTAMESRRAFKANRAAHMAAAGQKVQQIAAMKLDDVKAKADRAGLDWPQKKSQLDSYYQRLEKLMQQAQAAWQTAQAENVKPEPQIQWAPLVGAVETINVTMDVLPKDRASLLSMIQQLYTSWDKILADMEIVEGYEVEFYHTYKVVKVTIKDMASKASDHKTETVRSKVTKSDYEKNKDKLGMTVASKPAGKFDNEVETVAQPPGYAYMASPSRGRNQYGYWQTGSSGSFWVWYGQYSFMRDIFWGASPGYRVYDRYWDDYDRSRRGGRSYYGATNTGSRMYGSSGVYTRNQYSGSKYVKSGGFRNSKYVKSGGSYRGTRYASSSRSRSSSRSSGGSFRSSSYGSSSRFGGGK